MPTPHSFIHIAESMETDLRNALDELLPPTVDEARLTFIFPTDSHDLEELGNELKNRCKGTVIGCTSLRTFGPTQFHKGGTTLISFNGPQTHERTWVIENLEEPSEEIEQIRKGVDEFLAGVHGKSVFAVLLVDGLCEAQLHLTQALSTAIPNVPIIRGSACHETLSQPSHVMFDGEFCQHIATFTLVTTELPFSLHSLKQHRPTGKRLAITKSEGRRVLEIDGIPAAEAYADAVGVPVDALGPAIFARNPLMFHSRGQVIVQSPHHATKDGSMDFSCALAQGTIVRLGEPKSMPDFLAWEDKAVFDLVGEAAAFLVFDSGFKRRLQGTPPCT